MSRDSVSMIFLENGVGAVPGQARVGRRFQERLIVSQLDDGFGLVGVLAEKNLQRLRIIRRAHCAGSLRIFEISAHPFKLRHFIG